MKLPSFPIFNKQNVPEEDFNPFPDLSPTPTQKKFQSPEFIKGKTEYLIFPVIFLLFLGFFSLGIFLYSKYYSPNINIFTNTKQTSKIPSERAQIYEFSHEPQNTKPQPYKIIIDPLNPKPGETLNLTIYIEHATPITTATATLETDNDLLEQPLILSDGNNKKGVWTTNWKVEDTHNNTFQINLIISDDVETYEGGILII